MEYVRLGTTGLKVSRLALGCMTSRLRDRVRPRYDGGHDGRDLTEGEHS
jgi:aryl-alcohol dehydrogenase-like predicted oxidoreductase